MKQSPFFVGHIGETVSPAEFPSSNYLIDDSRYSYEGNWTFCRFDSEEVFGARFGFGRGAFDTRDYGSAVPLDRSNLWVHLELMTHDGAVLWIGTGRFKAEQVRLDPNRMDACLLDGRREVFRINGWPQMTWHFESDDGDAEVNMELKIQNVTILPDCVLPHNRFAMWLAICRAEGEVRFKTRRTKVSGVAFYDHPRINIGPQHVPPFGWYFYTPMVFTDGSHLAGYYCRDGHGDLVEEYCFGLHVGPRGNAVWLPEVRFGEIRLDDDGKPKRWNSRWKGPGWEANLRHTTRSTSILKAWGGPSVAQTRRDNANIPLVFDCEGEIATEAKSHAVRGGGLAEFLVRTGLSPQLP